MDSHNLRAVKRFWGILEREGLAASTEAMLDCCHEDVELSPYSADGRVLRGVDEARAFMAERERRGWRVEASAWDFTEQGDEVIVSGSIRVHRSDGSLADAQLRWIYAFSEGRVKRARVAPLLAVV